MTKRQRAAEGSLRFTRFLLRASVLPLLAFSTIAGYLVGSTLIEANTATSNLREMPPHQQPTWDASYSRQFPSCVALVLWPERERPVAFVVKRGAEVERMSVRAAYHALSPRHASRTDDVRIIGACRRG